MGRSIGLDVHRDFCEVAIADGGRARSAGRIATTPEMLELFARSLAPTDRVVMEATGNALAIARILEPHVAEVVLAHAKQVRAISHARIKTDKIDAKVLARPAGRRPDPGGVDRRRARADAAPAGLAPARRWSSGARRSRTRSRAALHRNLKGRNPASDPFGKKGRAWIAAQQLPIDERLTVDAGLRQLDFLGDELAQIDRLIAQQVLDDADVRRLLTIPGIDVVTAATLVAVIGDVRRFPTPRHLVGYLGPAPDDPPVGQRAGASRPPVEGGLGRRPTRARRGRVVGRQGTRAAARLRAAHRRAPRPPRRDRRRRAQAAPCSPGTCSRAARTTPSRARASCAASSARSSSRPARRAPSPARTPIRSGTPPATHAEKRARRAGRGRLPPTGRRLAGHRPEGGCGRDTGARIFKALEGQGRAAGHKPLTPALRHVSHPHPPPSVPQGARTRQAV